MGFGRAELGFGRVAKSDLTVLNWVLDVLKWDLDGLKNGVNIGFRERREGSRKNVETLRERFERQREGVRTKDCEKASSKENRDSRLVRKRASRVFKNVLKCNSSGHVF